MTSDSANPYPDDTEVLVRFPRSQADQQADRDAWPVPTRRDLAARGRGRVAGVRGVPRGRHGRRWHARARWDAG